MAGGFSVSPGGAGGSGSTGSTPGQGGYVYGYGGAGGGAGGGAYFPEFKDIEVTPGVPYKLVVGDTLPKPSVDASTIRTTLPRCERHGPMRPDPLRFVWICNELGCWSSITDESLRRLPRDMEVVVR